MPYHKLIIGIIVTLFISGCDNIFEFSPYQANVQDDDKNQTLDSYKMLETGPRKSDTIAIALMADSHYHYDELEEAVTKINTLDIDFTVHLGDFTDKGLLKEYELYSNYISELNKPVFTCIGNHDYLSSGSKIYRQMFGEYNYSFYYRNKKFIFFDATTFESGKKPNFTWLQEELNDTLPKIILSHIPPWDDQYLESDTERFKLLSNNKNIVLSIHGHHHSHTFSQNLNGELNFLIPGSTEKMNICIVKLWGENEFSYEFIPF